MEKEGTSPEYTYPVLNMREHLQEMRQVLADFIAQDTVNRIWRKDYTVCKSDPSEISNRLGWLDIVDRMLDQIRPLQDFANEIREALFHHVVLLGMGGSSLGPEVLEGHSLNFQGIRN